MKKEENAEFDRVLIVMAHPDDEILGCGATTYKISSFGSIIRTVILGEGKTSRDNIRDRTSKEKEIEILRKEVKNANSIVGTEDTHLYDFPDNRFDTVPLLDIVKVIESNIDDFNPTAVITHWEGDLNVDHKITQLAVLTATRPLPERCIKIVMSSEILSSTGWHFSKSFDPNFFVSVNEESIKAKINGMAAYESELSEYPHPRSLASINDLARYRGAFIGSEYAEAFKIMRWIKK